MRNKKVKASRKPDPATKKDPEKEKRDAAVPGLTEQEKKEKTLQLAEQVMEIFRDCMAGEMMYLTPLLFLLKLAPDREEKTMSTDGEFLYYNPVWLLRSYAEKNGYGKLKRHYLHVLSHCMLHHVWERPEDRALMDSAFDVAAELLAERIPGNAEGSENVRSNGTWGDGKWEEIRRAAGKYSAAAFRDFCVRKKYSGILQTMGEQDKKDDHTRWEENLKKSQKKNGGQGGLEGIGNRKNEQDGDEKDGDGKDSDQGEEAVAELMKKKWTEAMNDMLSMMPTDRAEKLRRGLMAGGYVEDVTAAEENRSDYRDLLRSYMLLKERRIEDPEMIDVDWYTLGIELYGNIPIIEYPESSETPVADDIVIAIDTSGSCGGEIASRFLRETCNMIRDLGIGRERVNIRILECDAEIENEIVIHGEDDLPEFDSRQMHGFGGTSFVPVFRHVDSLLEMKEMRQVRCLLYLSDTWGDFPEQAPEYDTIFVVPEEDYGSAYGNGERLEHIPEWVRIVVLTEDDLKAEP